MTTVPLLPKHDHIIFFSDRITNIFYNYSVLVWISILLSYKSNKYQIKIRSVSLQKQDTCVCRWLLFLSPYKRNHVTSPSCFFYIPQHFTHISINTFYEFTRQIFYTFCVQGISFLVLFWTCLSGWLLNLKVNFIHIYLTRDLLGPRKKMMVNSVKS